MRNLHLAKRGRSAYGAAAVRAIEVYTPKNQRLFDDALVIDLLPRPARWVIRVNWVRNRFIAFFDRKAPGIRGALLCRTRAIDDAVTAAVRAGVRTVVILGAGLDTRPYRLPELASLTVFEVDLPEVQQSKRARLGRVPANVRFVPIDFDRQPLDDILTHAGLDPREPAVFVWEGVTQYLQPEAVDLVLRAIAQRPRGTELVFTYVLEEAIRKGIEHQPEPWYFGIDPVRLGPFLQERGLDLREDAGAEEHEARYLHPSGRRLEVSPIERVARAVVN